MRTIRVASISLVGLMAAGTLTAAAGQPGQRPPSEVLKRVPATPATVARAVEQVPAGPMRLGGIGETGTATRPITRPGTTAGSAGATRPVTRPGTTAGTATQTRPVTQPKGILKNPGAGPTAGAPRHVQIRPDLNRVREIPARTAQPTPTAQAAAAPRHAPRHAPAAAAPRHAPRHAAAGNAGVRASAHTAGRAAATSTGRAVLRGGAMGVVGGAVVGVGLQELQDPGRTVRDLKNGHINWADVAASAGGGMGGAVVAAAGAGAAPVVIVGAATTGAVLIVHQEITDPGKTARDIKAMTNGAIDLKKAGSDVNKAADTAAKDVKKAASTTAADVHKAGKDVLGFFGIK